MYILVSGATKTVRLLLPEHPNLGVLLTPADGNTVPPPGVVWAADNSAFSGFDEARFVAFLGRLSGRGDCAWVAAPDVVGDAGATLARWPEWSQRILGAGQRPAFVVQNGQTVESAPWDSMGALFVGGSPECVPCGYVRPTTDLRKTCPACGRPLREWKVGAEAVALVRHANALGLWTHMGRVNTARRISFARAIGCRSVDGSSFSKHSATHLPWALRAARQCPLHELTA